MAQLSPDESNRDTVRGVAACESAITRSPGEEIPQHAINDLEMPARTSSRTGRSPASPSDGGGSPPRDSSHENSSLAPTKNRSLRQLLNDAAEVCIESLKFAYKADSKVTVARMGFSAVQSLQFLVYGALVEKIAETVRFSGANSVAELLPPVAGAFGIRVLLDSLQGRSNSAEAIQQSKIEVQIQEKIRELAPKSLYALNGPKISQDFKLVCWGGIWGLSGASMDIIKAVGALTAIVPAVALVGWYASPLASVILAAGIVYPLYKTSQLSILQMRHEEEVASKRARASEESWNRVFPETARLFRVLGVQGTMDDRAAAARNAVVELEKKIAEKKNRANDIGHFLAGTGGAVSLLSLLGRAVSREITPEIAIFVGISIIPMFLSSLDTVGNSFVALVRGKPVLDAMRRLKEARRKETELEGSDAIQWKDCEGARLTAKELHFAYPTTLGGQRPVPILRDISFDLDPGSLVAIVGDNGSGKSTLLQLLDRSYPPTSGELCINGCSTAKVTDENLFRGLKCVPQHAQQLDRFTLRDFVSVGRINAGKQPDEALLERILTALGIDEMLNDELDGIDDKKIKAFPNGLDTIMGAQYHGVTLSGGELSLLYAASIIYSEAGIIVLDEPEKALTGKRQERLFATLHNLEDLLGYKPTVVLVTHLLTEVAKADKIMYVKKGNSGLAGYGSHSELLKTNAAYASWHERSHTLSEASAQAESGA